MVESSQSTALETVSAPEGGHQDGGRTPAVRPPSGSRRRKARNRRQLAEIVVLSGPALIVFVTFVIAPVILAGYFGFFKWRGYGAPTDFIGFDNYKWILGDPTFRAAILHNGFVLVMSLLTQGPIALLMALLMNRKIRGRSLIRVLIFVPYVLSEVIVGTGWRLILQPSGAFTELLDKLGLDSMSHWDWLGPPNAPWTMMMILTWKYIGFAVILFLAGMQGIPEELYEAAAVDGANYWQMQLKITLPLLGPTIRIWGFLTIIGSLQLFDLVYIMWGPVGQFAGVSTMATYMVYEGRASNAYGYGSATAVILFIITFTCALLYQRFVLRRDTAGALTAESK